MNASREYLEGSLMTVYQVIILKFAKLYDGVDFRNEEQLRKLFDVIVRIDFLQFK